MKSFSKKERILLDQILEGFDPKYAKPDPNQKSSSTANKGSGFATIIHSSSITSAGAAASIGF